MINLYNIFKMNIFNSNSAYILNYINKNVLIVLVLSMCQSIESKILNTTDKANAKNNVSSKGLPRKEGFVSIGVEYSGNFHNIQKNGSYEAPAILSSVKSVGNNDGLNLNGNDYIPASWFGVHGGISYITGDEIFTSIEAGINFGGFDCEFGKFSNGEKFKRTINNKSYAAKISSNFGARFDFILGKPLTNEVMPFFLIGGRYNRLNINDSTNYIKPSKNRSINDLGYAVGVGIKLVKDKISVFGKYVFGIGNKIEQKYEGKIKSSEDMDTEDLNLGTQNIKPLTHEFVIGIETNL